MNLRTGMFGVGGIGIAVLTLGGTAIQEAVKGAANSAGARGAETWLRATIGQPSQPVPRPPSTGTAPSLESVPACAHVGSPPRSPAEELITDASIDEAGVIRLLVAGDLAAALAAVRANPAHADLVPGTDLLLRVDELAATGDFTSARRVARRVESVSPRLAAVAEFWKCRVTRLQKGLPDDLACLAAAGLASNRVPRLESPTQRSNP